MINFANPDMVGHTGVIPAVVEAVETVDRCLGAVVDATHAAGGVCLVTADHGNAEQLLDDDGVSPHTAHTTNPVPLILTSRDATPARRRRALRPARRPCWSCSISRFRQAMTGVRRRSWRKSSRKNR